MSATVACRFCGSDVELPPDLGKRQPRCPRCGETFEVAARVEPAAKTPPHPESDAEHERLRRVARYQRWVMLCMVFYLVAFARSFFVPAAWQPLMVLLPMVLATIVGAIFVLMLSFQLYGVWGAIAMGCLTFAPCMGFIVLLIVNGAATRTLKKHGYRVGFFGASPSQFRRAR